MSNRLLTITYDGAGFCGSQWQKNGPTVLGCLQGALESILGEKLALKACSRTDAKVHANEFCVSFKSESKIGDRQLVRALNAKLPDSIAAINCTSVPDDFHARYSAKGKRYIYKIWNEAYRSPFFAGRALFYPRKLDEALLDSAAKDFLGRHDFAAFCSAGSSVSDTVRTITDSAVRCEGEMVTVSVTGDGFLYNMVRIMVGTLLEIGEGRIPTGAIPAIIESRDRKNAGRTAPAEGLYLDKVFY